MNSDSFYAMTPGTIGYISYLRKRTLSEDTLQNATNNISSGLFGAYLSDYSIVGAYGGKQMDPAEAFAAFRNKAREFTEENASIRVEIPVQVGQDESIRMIKKIQSAENFMRWEDENIVRLLLSTI